MTEEACAMSLILILPGRRTYGKSEIRVHCNTRPCWWIAYTILKQLSQSYQFGITQCMGGDRTERCDVILTDARELTQTVRMSQFTEGDIFACGAFMDRTLSHTLGQMVGENLWYAVRWLGHVIVFFIHSKHSSRYWAVVVGAVFLGVITSQFSPTFNACKLTQVPTVTAHKRVKANIHGIYYFNPCNK
jgi:hypothetical protein